MAQNKIVIRGPVVDEWTRAFKEIGDSLKTLTSSINKSVELSTRLENAFNNLEGFKDFIRLAKQLSEVQAQNFSQISAGVKDLSSALKTVTSIPINKLVDLPDNIQRIANAIKNVPSTEKLKSFFDSFRELSNLRPVNLDANAAVPIAQLGKITTGLEKLGDVSPGDIAKSVKTFALASSAFKLISKAISFIPGGNELEKLALSFGRIGEGLDAFRRLSQFQINKANIINLGKALLAFVVSIRGITKFTGDPEKIKALATLLKEVRGIFSIIPGTKEISLSDVKEFKEKLDIISKAIRDLSKVGQGGLQLPDIAGAIKRAFGSGTLQSSGQQVQEGFLTAIGRGFSERIGQTLYESVSRGVRDFISGQGLRDLGDQMRQAGETLIQGFGLQRLVKSQGFDLALEFDDISKQIGVFAKNLPIKEAQAFANEIGIQYPLSANAALSAILDLSKAGQGFADIRNILPSAADLAAISESGDLDKVTKFLITAEAGFNKFADGIAGTFENTDIAANVVFRAANVSTAAVDSLIEGLQVAAPIANRFNISLQDTASFLTLFEDAGIRGSQAGNLFATVLSELSKPRSRKELERLNVAWKNQDGTLRSTVDILDDVQKKYEELNLTQVQVSNSLSALGGDKFGQQGLSIIFGRGGINDVNEAIGDVTDVTNSANQAAQDLLGSLKGQITQLQGSWETLLTTIFLPMLDKFFLPVVKAARSFVDFLLEAPPVLRDFISNFIILASAGATIVGAFLAVAGVLTTFAGILQGVLFHIVRMVVLLPATIFQIGAFAASLAGAVAVIGIFLTAAIALNSVFTGIISAIENNVGGLGDIAQEIGETLSTIFTEFNRIAKTVTNAFALLFDRTFNRDAGSAIGFISNLLNGFLDLLKAVRATLESITLEDIAFAVYFFGKQLEFVLGALGQFGEGIVKIFKGDFSGGINAIADGFDRLRKLVLSTINLLFGPQITANIDKFFSAFSIDRVLGIFGNLRENAISAFAVISRGIAELTVKFAQFGQGIERVWRLIQEFFGGGIDLNQLFKGLGAELSSFVIEVGNALSSVGSLIAAGLNEILFNIAPSIVESIGNLLKLIGREIRKIPLLLAQIGRESGNEILEQFGQALFKGDWAFVAQTVIGLIFAALSEAINKIGTLAIFLVQKLFPPGQIEESAKKNFDFSFIFDIILNSIKILASSIGQIATGIIKAVRDVIVSVGFLLVELGRDIGSDFLKALGFVLRRGDILKAFLVLVDGFLAGIQLLLRRIPVFIQIAGRKIGSELILNIGKALTDGRKWNDVATNVVELIQSAFSTLVTTLANVGAFILNSIFGEQQVDETGENIGNRIVKRIFDIFRTVFNKRALAQIFGAAVQVFAALVSEVLNLPGRLLVQVGQQLENSGLRTLILGIGTAFEVIAIPVTYVSGLLFRFGGIIADIVFGIGEIVVAGSSFQRQLLAFGATAAIIITNMSAIGAIFASLPGLIAAGIVALKAFAAQAARVAFQAAGIVSVLIIFQSLLNNLDTFEQRGIGEGLARTFFDIGKSVLSFLGVSDEIIDKVDNTIDVIIFAFRRLILQLGSTINRFVAGIQVEISKIVEGFKGINTTAGVENVVTSRLDSKSGVGLVGLGEDFANAIASGQEAEIAAFEQVLRAQSQGVLDNFLQLVKSGSITALDENQLTNVLNTVAASGNVQEIFTRLGKRPEELLLLMDKLSEVNLEAARAGVNEFVDALETANLSDQQIIESVQVLDNLLERGVITQERYNDIVSETFDLASSGNVILNEQGEIVAEVARAWEEMDENIAGVSDKLGTNINDLSDWVSSAEDADQQAERLNDIYTQLFDLVDFGEIGRADADAYFDTLLQQMGILRQSERDKLNPFRGAPLEADLNLNVNAPNPEDVKNDPDYVAFLKELQDQAQAELDASLTVDDTAARDFGVADTPESAPDFTPEAEEVEKDKKEIEKLNERFNKQEKKALDDIAKTRETYTRDFKKLEEEAYIKRERDAQDHQKRLNDISKAGAQGVVDAVAARDSAAAQSAITRSVEEKQREEEKFNLDRQRAAEDLERRKQELTERAQLRIAEQQERLQEIRIEHQQELAELQSKQQEELAETKAHNAALLAEEERKHQEALAAEKEHSQEILNEGEQKNKTLGQQISTLWDSITGSVNKALSNLSNSSNSFLSSIGKAGQSLVSNGSSIFSKIGSVIKDKVGQILGGASSSSSLFGKISNTASSIIGAASNVSKSLFGGGSANAGGTSKFGYKSSSFSGSASSSSGSTSQLLSTVKDNLKNITGIFGGLSFGGTKHQGGPTRVGQFYHVGGTRPELYQERGNTYLIPSGAGQVTPPAANPFARIPSSQENLELNFNAGGMNFNGANFDSDTVLKEMENVIIPKLSDVIKKVRLRKNSV